MPSPPTRFIVSDSRYLGHEATSALDICRNLDLAVRLDLHYHFSGPLCASYWIDLCQCREYGHDRLVGAIEAALPMLLDALRDRLPRPARLGLVSLGPGDGGVDVRLLDRLRPALQVTSYRCVDFSFELLAYAVRHVRASGTAAGLPITALCTDFQGLDGFVAPGGDAALWLLTGYTVGNQNEARLVRDIARRMRPGDYLLLDAHLHALHGFNGEPSGGERMRLVHGYDNATCNRFAFGPVETVTTAVADDVAFGYRIGRFVTTVPGAVNVVVCCRGLEARMRLTADAVSRDSLDLCSTTLYDFELLRAWLAASPLQLLGASRHDDTGIFLLEKAR
jgi:hypothetical protein